MTQLLILSGKGGTGKTNLCAAFCHMYNQGRTGKSAVLVDADVDAANLGFLLDPEEIRRETFIGGAVALIDQDICNSCGRCQEVCRYNAVTFEDGNYEIDPIPCDGCAACVYQCPEQAISLEQAIGLFTISGARALKLDAQTGSLAVGKSADFIVLQDNLFEIPASRISDTRVAMTFFEGELVYKAPAGDADGIAD